MEDRVKSYMQVRWTKGRQLCYQDHIVNFRQDITEIATRLPRLPDRTDIVVIRKEDVDPSRHVDLMVRREKEKAALQYKIAHDPDYADLIVDDVLRHLPENGSVADRIPTCREDRQDGGAMPVGPGAAAADGEGENEDELRVGGVMDLRIKNALRLSNSDVGAAQTIAGMRYEQTIVSFHKTLFSRDGHPLKINAPRV
jgi:hypothetical protein